jgi:WD40 repeat protein
MKTIKQDDDQQQKVHVQQLDHQVNDIEYSTHYKNICCAGTMNYNNWYHGGDLYLLHMNTTTPADRKLNVFNKLKNRTGVHSLTWSEHFVQTVMCGNHDGSINFWNVNKGRKLVSLVGDKGYPINSVDWNQLDNDYILTAASSSRVKMFDISNLDYVSSAYTEHTRSVNDVKWNTNNKDEFATASDDGYLKIWDRRASDQASVNTLMDRSDTSGLKCIDWHKKDVCIIDYSFSIVLI